MTELSRQAQAVLDAAYREIDYVPQGHVRWAAAAALRAAIDQVVPEPSDAAKALFSLATWRVLWVIRDEFHAIATELENHG